MSARDGDDDEIIRRQEQEEVEGFHALQGTGIRAWADAEAKIVMLIIDVAVRGAEIPIGFRLPVADAREMGIKMIELANAADPPS